MWNRTLSMRHRLLVLPAITAGLVSCGGTDKNAFSDANGLINWPDDRSTGADIGETAPNFRLPTVEGTRIVLAETVGPAPVVLNFLATWCANCMEEMDVLVTLASEGHTIIGVNLRESAATVRKLSAETGAAFPILLDSSGKVTRAYKVLNLPATAVLRTDGTIGSFIRGPITLKTMRSILAEQHDES